MLTYATLDRIEQRLTERGLSPRQASIQSGNSADLIRNWQRARLEGREFPGKIQGVASLAGVLGVTVDWLLHGDDTPTDLAEPTVPYTPRSIKSGESLEAYLAPATLHRMTLRIGKGDTALGVFPGDLVIIDAHGQPETGQIVLANIADDYGHAQTRVMRYAPPFLVSGNPVEPPVPIHHARVQGAIVALARGPGI